MNSRLSLRIPAILLAASLASSALIYMQTVRFNAETIRRDGINEINLDATQLQNILYNRLSEGNQQEALLSLSVTAMKPGIRVLLLADEGDRVMLASRYGWHGEPATRLSHYDNALAAQVREQGSSRVIEGEAARLHGYYPLIISYERAGLVKRTGVLFVEYDFGARLAAAQRYAAREALIYGGLTLGAAALIAILLHFLVSRRVRALAVTSARLAEGDLGARAGISGNDELSRLGQAFDHMAERIRADIANRARIEASLRLYASVFEHSGEAIMVTDSENRIVAVNAALTRHTGYSLDELRGQNPRVLASGNTPRDTYREMWAALAKSGYWQGELWDRRKDGHAYPKWAAITVIRNERGEISHHIASFTDITDRKAAEERIDYLAHHDPLTGLFNRYNLENRLGQAVLSGRRERGRLAVMFIDMDGFKVINDTLGHHAGDLLLVEVGRRLRLCVRDSDIVARLGGDEFIVALIGIEADIDAAPVAEKILKSLAQPYLVDDKTLHSSASIGISVAPTDGDDAETLMKHADAAMYHAKKQGRNNYQFFSAGMTAAAHERLELEQDLRAALAAGQFVLHYQPKIAVADGRVHGVEALIRWQHPERGLVSPMAFIPIAEETGLIEALGEWVLDEACRQQADWQARGIDNAHVSVNLSAHQLRSPTLGERVRAIMTRHGIDAGRLELEVTESVAMDNPARAIEQLKSLRELGVDLAIDDFGTGYSSLAYLKLLPIQTLKVDRAFVHDIESDENDAAICAATLALAHNLGLKVVAEGVETEAQRRFLVQHECEYLQGYLFSKPIPATEMTDFLRRFGAVAAA